MKRRVGILLVMVMSLAMLISACSAKNEAKKVDGVELPYVKLTVMYPFVGGDQKDKELVEQEINKYLMEKLNCEVNLDVPSYGSFTSKWPLMLQTNEQLDLLWVKDAALIQNIPRKAFTPLDDLLQQHGQGIASLFTEQELNAMKINGTLYGISTYKELAANNCYFYDDAVAKRNGIDYANITTYSQLGDALEIIKKNEKNLVPLWMNQGTAIPPLMVEGEDPFRFELIQGIDILELDTHTDKIISKFDDPYLREKYKYMRSWYEKGYINQDASTTEIGQSTSNKNGKTWIQIASGKPGQEDTMSLDNGRKYGRGHATPVMKSSRTMMGSMLAIPGSSVDPERAMMLMNLLYTDKYLLNLMQFGIEDKHYIKVDENTIKLPQGIERATDSGYYPATEWVIGNQFLNYLWQNEKPSKWQEYEEYNKSATMAKSTGFIFDQTSIKTEIAAINTIIKEYELLIMSGTIDTDSGLKEMKAKLENTGSLKVLEEAQKQYEAWKVSKQ